MIKLKTGVSTSLDFVKAMKERGQDVSPAFPAETLREQLDALSEEVKVTFNSDNETVLQVVNDYEEGSDDNFAITLEYSDTPNDFGVYPIRLLPENITFNPDMVTVSDDLILPGEHAVVSIGSTLIPVGDYGLDPQGQYLVLGGDTFTEIFTENNNTLVGLVFDIHIDSGIGTKDDKVSAEFNKVFTYGDTLDGSQYPGEVSNDVSNG